MRNFISKLNTRQLIIHFIASWFFVYAFRTAANLYDHSFLLAENLDVMRLIFKERYNTDMFIVTQCGILGLLISYVIAWVISLKRNWFWANSVIIFLGVFLLYNYNLLGWATLRYLALAPGQIFGSSSVLAVIVDFIILLSIGCYLFFRKGIKDFIDTGVNKPKKALLKERVSMTELKKSYKPSKKRPVK